MSYGDFEFWNSKNDREEFIRVWNELASNASEDRKTRAEAIFVLFRKFLRPGFTSGDCRKILEHAGWLDQVRIEPVGGLAGQIPVELPRGSDSLVFSMMLPTDEKVFDDWCIYFTLTGLEPEEREKSKARDFLKGKLRGRQVRLHEFALCSPYERRDKTERFTVGGVGLWVH